MREKIQVWRVLERVETLRMLKGLGSLANLPNLLKQAQEMSQRVQQVNDEMKSKLVTGSSGGGMVEVDMNGLGTAIAVRIAPELLVKQDRELLEDLLPTAYNAAQEKAKQMHAEVFREAAGGLSLPGLSDVMSQIGSF